MELDGSPFQGVSGNSGSVVNTLVVSAQGSASSSNNMPTEERLPKRVCRANHVVSSGQQAQSALRLSFVLTSKDGVHEFGPHHLLDPSWVSTHQCLILSLLRDGFMGCRLMSN